MYVSPVEVAVQNLRYIVKSFHLCSTSVSISWIAHCVVLQGLKNLIENLHLAQTAFRCELHTASETSSVVFHSIIFTLKY